MRAVFETIATRRARSDAPCLQEPVHGSNVRKKMPGAAPSCARQWPTIYLVFLLVVTVTLLLAGFGSELLELTVAVFTIRAFPRRLTLTFKVSVALGPLARLPRLQVTVPPAPTGGALEGAGDALANVVPCGTASFTTTPVAGLGPRLETTIV